MENVAIFMHAFAGDGVKGGAIECTINVQRADSIAIRWGVENKWKV